MLEQAVANIQNIKNLKSKLESLAGLAGVCDNKIQKAISNKMIDDVGSLNWAVEELVKTHFTPVILCASNSVDVAKDFLGWSSDLIIVCFAPTKVEATVLHKYFITEDIADKKLEIKDLPPYLICDGYRLDNMIFIEGFILNSHIEEVGKKEIKEQLSVWVKGLLNEDHQTSNSENAPT
jgi:hypothetical protein